MPAAPRPVPRTILFGVLASIVLLGVGAVALASGGDGSAIVVGTEPSPGTSGRVDGIELVVDVGGAVLHPGVYHLRSGARVGDAITAAGGYGPRVDAARAAKELNLASPIQDGQRVQVPSRDDTAMGAAAGASGPGSTAGAGAAAGAPVNLNRATAADLEALPGIGPATAAKIIASRETTLFAAVQDLRDRKLVGQKTFDGLKDLVTVR